MAFLSVNENLAVEPFPTNQVEKEVKNGLAFVKQKSSLQPLKVVFSDFSKTEYAVGYTVYVRADQCVSTWAKDVFELNGKKFILVPKNQVILVEKDNE
ncbi:hypothetical protein EBT16_01495 [bacterium]|nr:hypothetical protein [bacterium]